jgi:hypothetical protein
MVLAVELVTVLPDVGMVGLEDDIVITQSGCEDLTTIGRHLHVCGTDFRPRVRILGTHFLTTGKVLAPLIVKPRLGGSRHPKA